jgi:hypothetical protein
MKRFRSSWRTLLVGLAVLASLLGGAGSALLGVCGPFTDVSDAAFCPFVLEIFYLGITNGTTPTTYSPADPVSRLQMAAFLSRTVDGVLKRGSRRAALGQFWKPQDTPELALTTIPAEPNLIQSDGADLWIAANGDPTVSRVRASDGKLLEVWTGASIAGGILVAMGRVFATGQTIPGRLYQVDPREPAGAVTTVASNLGNVSMGIAFDGSRIWTGNRAPGSVSIVTPGATVPWAVTTVTTGFQWARGVLYDGVNVWVTDRDAGTLLRLDGAGAILQTVTVGTNPEFPAFDGTNIWVPNFGSGSASVVRASTGAVLATLTNLTGAQAAAFDGERVAITNWIVSRVSLFKAADLSPLGSVSTGVDTNPYGVCSDGINFWVTLSGKFHLVRL